VSISEKLSENIDGHEVQVKHLVFTVSNFLSFSRIPAAIILVYLHSQYKESWTWGIFTIIVYIVLSDFLDGWVARWLNQVSELGKSIDPFADKLGAFIMFYYLISIGWIPYWFLWFFVIRDGMILMGSTIIKIRYGKVAMSVMSGKISVNVLALYWLATFFYPEAKEAHVYILSATVAIMVYSFFDYMIRFFKIIKGAEFN